MRYRFCIANLFLLSSLLGSAQAATPQSAITLDAASSEIDGRSNEVLLHKVIIRQQGYVIRADRARATGLDFENSHWVFSGSVDITTPDGHSTGDEATVNFADNRLQQAQLTGQPATFEQRNIDKTKEPAQPVLASGRANNMTYDFNKNTVRLTGQAWIQYNQNEFRGNSVTYDIPQRKVLARSEDQQGERVHITIKPNDKSNDKNGANTTDPVATP